MTPLLAPQGAEEHFFLGFTAGCNGADGCDVPFQIVKKLNSGKTTDRFGGIFRVVLGD